MNNNVERLNIVTQWITSNQNCEKTIFTDEKRFTLDGPDDWRTYDLKNKTPIRNKRQCKGGGILCWLMCMPNGLNLYRTFRNRLVVVLMGKGDLCNK